MLESMYFGVILYVCDDLDVGHFCWSSIIAVLYVCDNYVVVLYVCDDLMFISIICWIILIYMSKLRYIYRFCELLMQF